MKILHTSDLHLGRQFNGISLEDDHAAVLDQIARTVVAREVDVLIIAGDIFDRASPPASAVRQFNGFLERIANETEAAVVMIAGNHDSGDRVGAMAIMTDRRRALIRGAVSSVEKPFVISDAHGPVAFSGLPFAYEYAARECFENEALQSPEDVLAAQVAAARGYVPEGARWVIVAHSFVTGALTSESERPITRVGGIDTVSSKVFDGAAYVALGHLHRPQSVGAPHIRYSGSPLAFGFDEEGTAKSMSFVEIDAEGNVSVDAIPFEPLRRVRVLTGSHAELLLAAPSNDFVKAILTDDVPVIDGMKRLREVFPNACDLVYARDERGTGMKPLDGQFAKAADPIEVVGDFLELVRDERLSEKETDVIAQALERLRNEEDAA